MVPGKKWMRTRWEENGVIIRGHAGRRGWIMPAPKESGFKFVAFLYNRSETHYDDTVMVLKKILDSE